MEMLTEKQAKITSILIVSLGLFTVFHLKLFSFAISILLIHSIIKHLTPIIEKYISDKKARLYSSLVISIFIAGIFVVICMYFISFLIKALSDIAGFQTYIIKIIDKIYELSMSWFPNSILITKDEVMSFLFQWFKNNPVIIKNISENTLNSLLNIIIGSIVGILIALRKPYAQSSFPIPILNIEIRQRLATLSQSFTKIVFAQVKISMFNTLFTTIYIAIILPLLDIHLPYMQLLLILTFVLGLIPIIGNIMSNTLICIASFSVLPLLFFVSLIFLVLIHKGEYFLNAKIIGSQINANTWELLIAMMCFKALFGMQGLIAAPIYYAYYKQECKNFKLL